MNQPRPLTSPPAEDVETITFRVPRKLGLSAAITKAAERCGRTRDEACALGLTKGLLDGELARRVG